MSSATKKGSLKKTFWDSAAGGLIKLATVGVAAAVAWQLILDPLFFPLLHGGGSAAFQGWTMFVQDTLGWIPDLIESALGAPVFTDSILAPYMETINNVATLDTSQVTLDDLV